MLHTRKSERGILRGGRRQRSPRRRACTIDGSDDEGVGGYDGQKQVTQTQQLAHLLRGVGGTTFKTFCFVRLSDAELVVRPWLASIQQKPIEQSLTGFGPMRIAHDCGTFLYQSYSGYTRRPNNPSVNLSGGACLR